MAFKKKGSSKKVYIGIFLLVILIVVTAAIIYATQPAPAKAVVGVQVGDSFTYSLMGTSNLSDPNAMESPSFSQYNDTDYYKVTITDVNGSSVSLDTLWRFKKGSEIRGNQTIDLSNGNKTVDPGFWAIYSSNLTVGDLLRPTGHDGLTVNLTETRTYVDSTREINLMFTGAESFLASDPTRGTLRYDYTEIYFDKQTGMLETLYWITNYNNPLKTEFIKWTLVNSTVWAVQ
jgi:hypothetical protein